MSTPTHHSMKFQQNRVPTAKANTFKKFALTLLLAVLISASSLTRTSSAANPKFAKVNQGRGGVLTLEEMQTETRTRTITVPRQVTTKDGRTITIDEETTEEFQVETSVIAPLPPTDTQFRTARGQDVSYREVYRKLTGPTSVVVVSGTLEARWLELLAPETLIVIRNPQNGAPNPKSEVLFKLAIPGTNVFSIARLDGRTLTLTLNGEETRYRRDEKYDTPMYAGYYSRRHKIAIRWPISDRGPLLKGSVFDTGAVRFRETQMQIVGVQTVNPNPVGPNDEVLMTVANESGQSVKIYYYDTQTQKERPYDLLAPGEKYTQPTYVGHLWFAKDQQDRKVAEFTIPREGTTSWVVGPPVMTTGVWKSPQAGTFISQGNGKWIALDLNSQITGRFEERERTDKFLAIYDEKQQRWVRLYPGEAITTGAGIDGWKTLGEGEWVRN